MRLFKKKVKKKVKIYKITKTCYNNNMQNVFTPFCSLVLATGKNNFLGGRMYDYTVEMMRKYQPKEKVKWEGSPYYREVAEGLFIVTADGDRKPADKNVKELFRKTYERYVERRLHESRDPLAIFMFQGWYKPIFQRNRPRKGMVYIEDNVQQVIKVLPKLLKGERYGFPALRIIREEEGTEAFVLSR